MLRTLLLLGFLAAVGFTVFKWATSDRDPSSHIVKPQAQDPNDTGEAEKPGAPHRVREWYYPLKEGKTVKEGELLGMIDPQVTESELFIKIAKLSANEAEAAASRKTRDEAKVRADRGQKLLQQGAIGREEYDALVL